MIPVNVSIGFWRRQNPSYRSITFLNPTNDAKSCSFQNGIAHLSRPEDDPSAASIDLFLWSQGPAKDLFTMAGTDSDSSDSRGMAPQFTATMGRSSCVDF